MPQDIDYHLNGKHEHNKQMAEQYLTVRYGKGNSVVYHSRLAQTQKQRNITVDLTYPGRDVKLNADLSLKDEVSFLNELSAKCFLLSFILPFLIPSFFHSYYFLFLLFFIISSAVDN